MDKLKALAIFVEVVKYKSFTKAAEQLNLSAPAVTRNIATLEMQLGAKLFYRTTRQVHLSEAGSQFFIRANNILSELVEAENEIAGHGTSPSGTITISAPTLFGQRYLTPVVLDYMKNYPMVSVRTFFSDKISHLIEENIDVALRIGHLKDEPIYATTIGYVNKMVCASPRYLAENGQLTQPEDIIKHAIIYPTHYEPSPSWSFYKNNQVIKVKVSPKLFCDNKGSSILAAKNAFGLTKVFSYQTHEELKFGSLQRVLEEYEEPPTPINLIRMESNNSSAKIKSFVDYAAARLKQNPIFQ